MVNCGSPEAGSELSTHQAFRARVYDGNQQKADWEPCFGICQIEIPERYYPKIFHRQDAKDADGGLDAQKQEVHGKATT
jgi:hypothetical protein